jgi:ABC-type multidrug transport system fused ATPase/permease subunit
MAPRRRSHFNEQPALIVIAVVIVMFLDDHQFTVIAVSVPAPIMVPIAVLVASLNDNCSHLRLRRRSGRQYEAESRQRGECQYDLAHIFSSMIPTTINDVF